MFVLAFCYFRHFVGMLFFSPFKLLIYAIVLHTLPQFAFTVTIRAGDIDARAKVGYAKKWSSRRKKNHAITAKRTKVTMATAHYHNGS